MSETISGVGVDAIVMRKMLINLYNTAYSAGHDDTVEGQYTHVLPVDMDSYHDDVVDEWLNEYLADEAEERAYQEDCGYYNTYGWSPTHGRSA